MCVCVCVCDGGGGGVGGVGAGSLRKHAYSNILTSLPPKKTNIFR